MNENNWDGYWKVRADWLITLLPQVVHGQIHNADYEYINSLLQKSYYQSRNAIDTSTNLEEALRSFCWILKRIRTDNPNDDKNLLANFEKQFLRLLHKYNINSEKDIIHHLKSNLTIIGELLILLYQFEFLRFQKSKIYYEYTEHFLSKMQLLYIETQNLLHLEDSPNEKLTLEIKYFKQVISELYLIQQQDYQERIFQLEDYRHKLDELDSIHNILPTLEEKLSKAEKLLQKTDTRVDELNNLKNDFNIIVLKSGFDNIKKIKIGEKRQLKNIIIGLSVLILVIPIIPTLWLIPLATNSYLSNEINGLMPYVVKFAIEIFLIYLFRLNYLEYKSVLAQILQIDLRISLCQFINNYLEQTQDLSDKHALIMFEKLIFSNLQPDSGNIPSTFDGLDQLTNLFKSIREKS